MQAFTPIGVTFADISVTGQIRTQIQRITADLISDKTHRPTGVVFVDNSSFAAFFAESSSERIVKIGQHLAKLCLRIQLHDF